MEAITSGVHSVSVAGVNAYIIDGDEGVTLIDTLLPKRHGIVLKGLKEIGRSAEDVSAIILTHSHFDHAGGAEAIKALSGAAVHASAADAPAVRGVERPPPPPISRIVVPLRWVMRILPAAQGTVVEHVIGENVNGGLPGDLRVIDTPGHTPGHVSILLERDGGLCFVGDAGNAGRRGDVKRGWFNRKTSQLDASLCHIAEFEFQIACFGHSAPIMSDASGAFRRFADALE